MASKSKLTMPRSLRQPTQFGSRLPMKAGSSSQIGGLKKTPVFTKEMPHQSNSDQKENDQLYDCNENQEPSKLVPKPRTIAGFSKLKTPGCRIGYTTGKFYETKPKLQASNENVAINTSEADGLINIKKNVMNSFKTSSCSSASSLSEKKQSNRLLNENSSHNLPTRNFKYKPMNMKSLEGTVSSIQGNYESSTNLAEGRKRYVEAKKQLTFGKNKQSVSAKKIIRPKIAKPVVRPSRKALTPHFNEENPSETSFNVPIQSYRNGLHSRGRENISDLPSNVNDYVKSGMFQEFGNDKETVRTNNDDEFIRPQTPPLQRERLPSAISVHEESDAASDVLSDTEFDTDLPLSLCSNLSNKQSCNSVNSFTSEDASEIMDVFNTRNNSLLDSKRKSRLKSNVLNNQIDQVKFDQMLEETRELKNLLLSLYKQLKIEENEKHLLKMQIKSLQSGAGDKVINNHIIDRSEEIKNLQTSNNEFEMTVSKLHDENSQLSNKIFELKSRNEMLEKEIKSAVKTCEASTNTLKTDNDEILKEAYHVIHDLQEKLKSAILTKNQYPEDINE